jgi:hypothetical protein
MSARKCSFVPLASLAILFLIAVASASAMAKDSLCYAADPVQRRTAMTMKSSLRGVGA